MSMVRRFLQKPGTMELTPARKLLPQVGGYEQRLRGLTDGELTAAARAARDDAEICACGREAARRALGERPYDVQILGTLAMLSGLIAEMATGEGKTLSGALAAAGHALRGRSVHVMSVNDYLARRDAQWMRPVYDLLGVTVGWIGQASTAAERRRAYAAQVTYAPVSEIGCDHGVHPDGRARHGHPARWHRGRPEPDSRARRLVRHRHRPAREQQARPPAARPRRAAGRSGRVGLLRQHGR
jgi:preprotein translocase subunit SecA